MKESRMSSSPEDSRCSSIGRLFGVKKKFEEAELVEKPIDCTISQFNNGTLMVMNNNIPRKRYVS